jgi:hypothetical protein
VWAPAAWAADATQAYDDATAAMCEAMDAPMPEDADESYAREMAAAEIDLQTRSIEQLRAWLEIALKR